MAVRIRGYALVAVSVAAVASCSKASVPDHVAALLARNAAYDRALVQGDSVSLDSLYHPDFTYLGPGGELRTRSAQLNALTSGRVDVVEGQSDSVVVRVYGSVAIVIGQFRGRARAGTDTFSFHERYSTTWLRENGSWMLVLEHGTIMREP